jgi:hypothetical protein
VRPQEDTVAKPELSAAIITELGQLFVATLKREAPTLVEGDLDGIEQRLQEVARTVFGPVVDQSIAAIAAASEDSPPLCPTCHQRMRVVDYERTRTLQGLVGDYTFARAYFSCAPCHHGHAPLDEQLGIGGGSWSPGLDRVACRLGIDDSFADAADAVHETLRIELIDEGTRRITEGIGQVAEAEAQALVAVAQAGQEPFPKEKGEVKPSSAVLLVEVDGVLVHEVDRAWHEMKVGLAAPLGPQVQADPKTGRRSLALGKPSYCAGLESAEAFWYRVYVEACRQGLGLALVTLVVVVGDGAEWIWTHAAPFLGLDGVQLIEIVDIYHAYQHLEAVATAVFGQGSKLAQAWVEPLKKRLEEIGAEPILVALGEVAPPDAAAEEVVRQALGYFTTNQARMDYPRFRALLLPIGSGVIESSCKILIEEREKGAGMRWTPTGAQAVASLRALHRSGRWSAFWKSHPQRRRPAVFSGRPPKEVRPNTSLKQAA